MDFVDFTDSKKYNFTEDLSNKNPSYSPFKKIANFENPESDEKKEKKEKNVTRSQSNKKNIPILKFNENV